MALIKVTAIRSLNSQICLIQLLAQTSTVHDEIWNGVEAFLFEEFDTV